MQSTSDLLETGPDLSTLSISLNDDRSSLSIASTGALVSVAGSSSIFSPAHFSPGALLPPEQDLQIRGLLRDDVEDYLAPLHSDHMLDFEFNADGEMIDISKDGAQSEQLVLPTRKRASSAVTVGFHEDVRGDLHLKRPRMQDTVSCQIFFFVISLMARV